ncbi:MAG: fluoride efflux transporter CrcB [Gemmatimonadota bacterium]|nr:fluoride efflux transporter CrcB [Gemmatimonadota bacterium]
MTRVLLVGLGGFVGSAGRYLIALGMSRWWPAVGLQFATLAVNVAGCFLIGLLTTFADARGIVSPEVRGLMFVGVLGGFTTFSTFALETLELGRSGATVVAAANVLFHIVGCLAAVWLGSQAGRALWGAA